MPARTPGPSLLTGVSRSVHRILGVRAPLRPVWAPLPGVGSQHLAKRRRCDDKAQSLCHLAPQGLSLKTGRKEAGRARERSLLTVGQCGRRYQPSCQPTSQNARVFPTRIRGVRAMGLNAVNLNLQRTFRIREGISFMARGDVYNALNHQVLDAPAQLSPTNAQFGWVTSEKSGNGNGNGRFFLAEGNYNSKLFLWVTIDSRAS